MLITGYDRLLARRELITTQFTGGQNSFFCESCQACFAKFEAHFAWPPQRNRPPHSALRRGGFPGRIRALNRETGASWECRHPADQSGGENRNSPARRQRSQKRFGGDGGVEGVLPESNRSADSHVRALRTPVNTSKTSPKRSARTQRSALRAFGQHALKLRRRGHAEQS
jgi:hypothetical protein